MPTETETALQRLDEAVRALAEVITVEDAKSIRDTAAQYEEWARRRKWSFEAEQDAAEIRLRAERRLGEILRDNPKAVGTRGQRAGTTNYAVAEPAEVKTLAESGINYQQSFAWQRIANTEEEWFDEYIAKSRHEQVRLSTNAILKAIRKREQQQKESETPPTPVPEPAKPQFGEWKITPHDPIEMLPRFQEGAVDTAVLVLPPVPSGKSWSDHIRNIHTVTQLCKRALNATGSIWMVCRDNYVSDADGLARDLDLKRTAWIVWHWRDGLEDDGRFPSRKRHLLCYAKDPLGCYFQPPTHGEIWERLPVTPGHRDYLKDIPEGRQIPVSLADRLLEITTPPNGVVIDPYCFVADVGVATVSRGCRYYGFESHTAIAGVAEARLKALMEGTSE